MDDLLVNCTKIQVKIENPQKTQISVYLCRFCSGITLVPDIAHNCRCPNAPDALKGQTQQPFYQATKITMIRGHCEVLYEKAN